jgi:hypothetical protein
MTELAFVFVNRFTFLVIVRFGILGNDMLTIQCHIKNETSDYNNKLSHVKPPAYQLNI